MNEGKELPPENGAPAKEIYVLMQNEYRISRNIRAQWFLNHLNKGISVTPKLSKEECKDELEIISAITDSDESQDDSSQIRIIPETRVYFLSTRYRLVFCLDLSPSVATVDSQHGDLFLDEVFQALEQSLNSVCKSFHVPGSQFLFAPQLHITVIAHVPNSPSGVPQVLVQGWILTPDNVHVLLGKLKSGLKEVIDCVAVAVSKANKEYDKMRVSSDCVSGSLLHATQEVSKVMDMSPPILTADISTLNLLRYGILALQLLPENSSAGIVVITDGVISFPNAQMQDSLLAQLRNSTVSCSFLQIGSPYHPFSCFCRLPYTELMQFISAATCGAYFPSTVNMVSRQLDDKPNAYHEALLYWSFQTTSIPDFLKEYEPLPGNKSYWNVNNSHFFSVAHQSRVRKKHTGNTLKVSLENVLSCRLREGYTVKSVIIDECKNAMEVRLLLPWNFSTNFEYVITSSLSRSNQRNVYDAGSCAFELIVDGCYEFLHDVTCSDKKPIKSFYRSAVIKQFWSYVKNLSHTDQILIQLHSFTQNPAHYTIPDSIKNGVPLSYLPANSTVPVLSNKSMAHSPFTTFWKPLCMLDINVWQKWMHTHRVGIILQHDMPLPKNMHLPNASGRYVHIQCRQAITSLNALLKEYSSFVLVENYYYIKFLYNDADKPPTSFYVIRVTSKAPCMVIRLAFLGGLPGYQRNDIVKDLRDRICNLKLPRRASPKEHHSSQRPSSVHSLQGAKYDINCCFLLKKPVEKILIRYERLPESFVTSVVDSHLSSRKSHISSQLTDHVAANMLITLSKYLLHRRWVWQMQRGPSHSLTLPTVSKILSVLTKIRLQEGFHFSHSSFGITYMVLEVPVEVPLEYPKSRSSHSKKTSQTKETSQAKEPSSCVAQYILFPPHTNTTLKDSLSEEEDSELPESEGELQLITECWIEPQYGITSLDTEAKNLSNLPYKEIPYALYKEDWECISVLTTFEHLCSMCHKKEIAASSHCQSSASTVANDATQATPKTSVEEMVPSSSLSSLEALGSGINLVPYAFNMTNLLPKCHQTEFLFPTLYEAIVNEPSEEVEDDALPRVETNELLLEYFIKNIKVVQDKELLLSNKDCCSFLQQVKNRPRSNTSHKVPFTFVKNSVDAPSPSKSSKSRPSLSSSNNTSGPSQELFEDASIPRLRCFMKGCSSSRFLITFVPATYADLQKLVGPLDSPGEQNNSNEMNEEKDDAPLEAEANAVPPKSSLTLPTYVYDCVLSSITSQLITPDENHFCLDNFESYTFDYNDSCSASAYEPEKAESLFEEDRKQSSAKKYDKSLLKSYHVLMDKAFSKCFVYSVYRSLVLDLPINKNDAVAAIDEICEESFLEVDITDFVYTICGHIKDFTVKQSVKQHHLSGDSSSSGNNDSSKQNHSPDGNATVERSPSNFPLSLLQRHQPCEQLQQKHMDIKERFSEILQGFLKKIPSRSDYYVFCLAEEPEEVSLYEDHSFTDQPQDESPNDSLVQNEVTLEKDLSSNAGNPEEMSLNTQSSLSSLDEDHDSNFSSRNELSPPLFVHLLCSIKSKQDMKSCSMPSLPTCLKDLQDCLDPQCTDIDLDEFRITLDITCLTLPRDIENPMISLDRQCSTSFSSNSPIPESGYSKISVVNGDSADSLDSLPETVQSIALRNIPQYQRDGIYKCIDKIKWLLMDEKASAALNSYPITKGTLNMVATHVKNGVDNSCCIVKEVPLKFVFGPESSLEKFLQVFERLSLPGYHLDKVEQYFYLVLDADSAEKQNKAFGSLNPPLGIASKYLLMQKNLHSDDSTALKNICDETQQPGRVEDDIASIDLNEPEKYQSTSAPLPVNWEKWKQQQAFQEDDTETEDDQSLVKTRSVKKSSNRSAKVKNPMSHRLLSVPSLEASGKDAGLKHSRSLPYDLHLLDSINDTKQKDVKKESSSQSADVSMESMWKFSNLGLGAEERLTQWASELPSSSHGWNLPLRKGKAPSVSSVPSVAKYKTRDVADSPPFFSDASVFGSCHFSNTEDGYDGDSSETGSEWDWVTALDTKRPVPPKFWLIMTVENAKVTIYFHIRHRKKAEDDEELAQSQAVLTQMVSVITNICKEVNQTLLLQSLHETRMCNRLLVPEESNDIWKRHELDPVLGTVDHHNSYMEEGKALAELDEKYLEANLRFTPGEFKCDVIWTMHFRLHHRLTSGQAGQKSKGLQAFRTVLNTFSVNNRENMFVYQETSGSYFYLRLYEEACEDDHSSNKAKPESSLSPSGSCCSSAHIAPLRKILPENEIEGDFRPRVNSGHSDTDRQDSGSIMSSSRSTPRCIVLHAHGIGEVGTEIKVDLVQVLQKRLNDCVLDMIIMMLSRNPLCKLTPEDVHFIQNPCQPPVNELNFTIPVKLLGHAHSIHMYLRQNMLSFLYNPKYTDNRKENHFKAYSHSTSEWVQVDDNDVFLYHSHQASGFSGSKGIACIILALVTGLGHRYEHLSHSLPNPTAYQDGFSENDFEELTSTQNQIWKKKAPGPVAGIRYQIWTIGKDTMKHIESRLQDAVRHALWDLLMEYKMLTAPISDAFIEDDLSCYSEPTTPVRARRTGRTAVDHPIKMKEFSSPLSLHSKEMSSSVPDIASKSQSPQSLQNVPVFQFNNGPQSSKPDVCVETSPSASSINATSSPSAQGSDRCNLNFIFHTVMKSFLQFGSNLGCPALSEHMFNLPSRHSISTLLLEIQNIMKGTIRDLSFKIFIRITDALNADTEFVPYNVLNPDALGDDLRPGTKRSFILVGRNHRQWKTYMGMADFMTFQESHADAMESLQKFQTHICHRSSERMQESNPASPSSVGPTVSISSPRLKSPGFNISDMSPPQSAYCTDFVPRQRLLLMLVEDKMLTVFLYNWSQDTTTAFLKQLTKLMDWHESRNALLNNLVAQKLGLFHGQTYFESAEKSEKSSKTEAERKQSLHNISWKHAEQLFQHHCPLREQTSAPSTSLTNVLSPFAEVLKNNQPPSPLHLSKYSTIKDPVTKHGAQIQDIRNSHRRDMQELRAMWKARDTSFHSPHVDRLLLLLKRAARLSHYCLTPLLFNPSWRWKVAPVRDHTVQSSEPLPLGLDKSPSDSSVSLSRSRHSSGSSLKNVDGASAIASSSTRSRRASGAPGQSSNQSSPKIRMKNPSEETWHQTVCHHYLLEYMQYLQTLGFVSLQTKEGSTAQGSRKSLPSGESKSKLGKNPLTRTNQSGPFYFVRYQLGGLLLFEVGLCDPYAYGHLYTIECSRLHLETGIRHLNSQFTSAFLDEVDKIKAMMHLHSFTYDYHLRTIHSYISGRQLIFRHGYHLTSFLDDFIKYYQKSPNCARNLLFAGTLAITDINMSGHQLYNYIISHNKLYGMTVLRMVPIVQESGLMMHTEFVLVELSARRTSYKDANDMRQMGTFDIGLLINHNIDDTSVDRNTLLLNYYIILTSQRELFPKLENFGTTLGSFQTVRMGNSRTSSNYPSRKTSTVSLPMDNKDKLESSGEETSSTCSESRSRKVASSLGITDEEVTYLGYFSSQETMMQQMLVNESDNAQHHLTGVFQRAAIHCRRDFLWSALLPRSAKEEESGNRDSYSSAMSYAEFSELLDLVFPVPLHVIDDALGPFLNMHVSWYKSLTSSLRIKYGDLYREFLSPDQTHFHTVVTHSRCPDSFMLLTIDIGNNRAELSTVFREAPTGVDKTVAKPSQHVLAFQSLVEEYVNVLCFQMWSTIIG